LGSVYFSSRQANIAAEQTKNTKLDSARADFSAKTAYSHAEAATQQAREAKILSGHAVKGLLRLLMLKLFL